MANGDVISLIDADPELGDLLDAESRRRAQREALTPVRRLSPGDWNVAEAIEPDSHHRGFLIIDGLISREVDVLGRRCVELLGAGDAPMSRRRWGGWSSSPPGWRSSTTA
jgi:CRP/FNR family cyclic AMP-dependent transcriptional regulator